jgi:hypothetical protein
MVSVLVFPLLAIGRRRLPRAEAVVPTTPAWIDEG